MKLIFDIGLEQEFFLSGHYFDQKKKKYVTQVYNANHEMQSILGYSIDQNTGHYSSRKNPSLVLPTSFAGANCEFHDLVTDGTAMEYRSFYKLRSLKDLNGILTVNKIWGSFPFLNKNRLKYSNYYGKQSIFIASVSDDKNKDDVVFLNVGKTFASQKLQRNAYTKECKYTEKKFDEKDVTVRTAGSHIHFSFGGEISHEKKLIENLNHKVFNINDYTHTDELVKIFDKLYLELFREDQYTKLRREMYQELGVYRLKFDTITGNPSLEYRQLSAGQTCDSYKEDLKLFIILCQREAENYLKSVKLLD